MWEFRRRPESLPCGERAEVEALFEKLPRLRSLHEVRLRFQRAFDTALDRRQALRWLTELWVDVLETFPSLEPVLRTFEAWQEGILNYFDGRQTSGPVEGINTKARVIVRRCYGLKSAGSLWSRLVLDLNRAGELARHTVSQMRELVAGFRAVFSGSCT